MAAHNAGNGGQNGDAITGRTGGVGFAGFTLDVAGRRVTGPDGAEIPLRRSEFALLVAFLRAPGRVLNRDHLLDAVSGRASDPFDRSIDVLVGRLRRKIEADPQSPALIVTVPGIGYKFAPPPRQPVAAVPSNGPRPAERRHLTVMLCGLTGLAALAEDADPDDMRALIDRYHASCAKIIANAGGTVARYLDDAIHAWFGYPAATEHSAERAIRAGLALIEAVPGLDPRLRCHIGLASGLVVMGGLAGAPSALGEAPDLAARLLARAGNDMVVISETCQRLAGGMFEYREPPPLPADGTTPPGRAFQVLGQATFESRFDALHDPLLTPLVGREEELDLLLRRWSRAKDGEGQVVLLSGEPGIGKSRVLSALRDRLDAQALRFQCSPYYVNSAFWPIIDNLEKTLKFARDETPDEKLDKLEALIVTQYHRPPAGTRFIASILSIPCEQRYGALPMTPQRHKDETLRTLVDLIEAAARQQPSVMLFEDAHWADPTTLEVLDLLIDRVKSIPLLVVITHRPEFQSRWTGHDHAGSLSLSRLTRPESAAMISGIAGGKTLPDSILEQILARTDGVPLFVEELTRSILESGELKETGGHFEYGGPGRAVTIPPTLRDSLTARLDRFPSVKQIAQIGAAIGRTFSYELIAAVAPMPQAQLDEALAGLHDSGLALRRGTPPDAVYTFKHALVRDAAYDSLLRSRRQGLHARIAGVIEERFPNVPDTEPELLAHHYGEAGMPAQAMPYWLKAGQLALSRMALSSAIAHLESGLRLIDRLPESPQRNDLELQLRITGSVAWEALRGWPAPQITEVLLLGLTLAKQSGQPNIVARTLWGLWVNPLSQGRIAESLRWADELVSAAEGSTDEGLTLIAHMCEMVTHFWLGNLNTAKTHGDTILALYNRDRHGFIARAMNHDPKTLTGLYAAHWLWMLGYPDQAARVAKERDAHARLIGHPFDLAFALTTGSLVYDYRCEPALQRSLAEEALDITQEHSLPFFSATLVPIMQGISMLRSGRFEQALEPMTGGLALWDDSGAGIGCPYYKSLVGEARARSGQLTAAIEIVDAMLAQIARSGWEERCHLAEVLLLKGWMLSLNGDLDGAEQNFLASLDWARQQQAKSWELRTSTSLARLWQSQDKRHDAYDLLAPVYNWFTEGFDTKDLLDAKALLADLV